MKLVDLQKKAISQYADGDAVEDYFDPVTGKPTDWHPGDSLAWFIALEIDETYDEAASDDEQTAEAIRVLERAIHDLQGAINGLSSIEEHKP